MIHRQESGRVYAWCRCGVCGKPRKALEDAVADDKAHREVCSAKPA